MIPKTDNAQIANITFSSRVRRMWGLDLHGWETTMLISLGFAAIAAVAVVVATAIVVHLQHMEAEDSKRELDAYKLEAAAAVAEANAAGETAKVEAARANES